MSPPPLSGHLFYRAPTSVSFGFADNVRIRTTPETEEAGVAGLAGEVFGWTTPSVTGVSVIGGAPDDSAINVSVTDRDEEYWFNPELIELVDVGAGATMEVGGKSFVKNESGEWEQVGGQPEPAQPNAILRVLRSFFGR